MNTNPWHLWTERLPRWSGLAWPQEPATPNWATPHEPLLQCDSVVLQGFGDGAPDEPVLIVTPQVNHSYIADFAPDQSLVRTLLAHGPGRVGVTDWLAPPARPYGIADSLEDILACMEVLGPKVHLVGLCQGGWQAAMVAALYPQRVASLVLAAAPIDFHAGATALHALTFGLPFAWFQGLVAASGGVAPGSALSRGFDLLRPWERLVLNPAALWLNLDDAAYVDRYRDVKRWYRLNKDVAGQLYLEVVRDLFQQNLLAQGRYQVSGRPVDLANIASPTTLIAGSRDHITPPEQLWALAALAPAAHCRRHLVDAGHIGVFMGRNALATVWPGVAQGMVAP